MRCNLLLVALSILIVADVSNSANIAGILELGLRFILINLKRIGNFTITDDATLTLPESVEDIIAGSIRLQDAELYGFDSLDIANLVAEDLPTSDGYSKANICLNLIADQLRLQTQYDADVGIINAIPIYGDGELKLAIAKVTVGLCLNINIAEDFSKLSVDQVSLQLKFRDSPSSITRFWKNDEVSEVVTSVINILETIIAMFITYEEECISCVLSPIVEYVINAVLFNNDDGAPDISCSCLEESFGNKYKLENKLERLIRSFHEDDMTNVFSEEDLSHLKEMFEITTNNIVAILNREGVNFDV